MAWVSAIVGLVGAYAASESSPGSATGSQGSLADLQKRIGSDQYQRYQQIYAPRERQLLDTVFDQSTSPNAEAARAGADAEQAANVAEQGSLRNARRLGINPSSPAFAALERDNQANRAGLIASAKTYGRRNAVDSNFQKQMGALGLGRNLATESGNLNSSAFNMYGTLAANEAAQDASKGQIYGQAAGYLTDAIRQPRQKPQIRQVSTGQIPVSMTDYTPQRGGLTDSLNDQNRRMVA